MFRRMRWNRSGTAALAALLLVPAIASAQFTPDAVLGAHVHADRVHDRAMTMAEGATEASERLTILAHAHRESADLRLLSDPRAFECNEVQANYLYLAGHSAEALKYLLRAATIAAANNDPFAAASAYVDAATVAEEEGWSEWAERLAANARRLAEEPGVSPEEREALQRRI